MDNALDIIQQWINSSKMKVQIIPRINHEDKCDSVLEISEHSSLGTIINYVGGISAANGFIRHFGGNNAFELSIKNVNAIENKKPTRFKGVLIVADDIFGGLFAINESLPNVQPGKMLYLPPDSYTWESLDIGHTAFLNWSMTGDVLLFYKKYNDVPLPQSISFDKVANFKPPLWACNFNSEKVMCSIIESSKMHIIRSEILEQLK